MASTSTSARAPSLILAEIHERLDELRRLGAATSAPGLHLTLAECQRLEDRTGLGSTRSAEALIAAVERLASLSIGEVRLPFTPGQLEELVWRAQKRGRTLESEVQAVVNRIRDELFFQGG
jgi:hypothetical protein